MKPRARTHAARLLRRIHDWRYWRSRGHPWRYAWLLACNTVRSDDLHYLPPLPRG